MAGQQARCQKKQKKSNDQKSAVIRYYLVKELRSLYMKYYLVTRGLSSFAKPYNNYHYSFMDALSLFKLCSAAEQYKIY